MIAYRFKNGTLGYILFLIIVYWRTTDLSTDVKKKKKRMVKESNQMMKMAMTTTI